MRTRIALLLLLPVLSFAQKKDTVFKYLDMNLQPTSKKEASYFGVAIRDQNSWLLYALYADTTPVIKAWFKDKKLQIKNGPYILYYPKNIVAQQGYYLENKMNGIWQSWHSNGQKRDSGMVVNNQLMGLWKEWYANGMLKYDYTYGNRPNNVLAGLSTSSFGYKDGSFTSWYDNGIMESTGVYKDDRMEGEWKFFHPNGQQSTIELYKDGKLNSMQCFDPSGKETGDFCSISKPAMLKGFGDYKQYIFQNLFWPEEAIKNNIEGTVSVRFTINKNGMLENLVAEGADEVLNKAVKELFESMKDWYPAVSHNRAIDWNEETTIPFYRKK